MIKIKKSFFFPIPFVIICHIKNLEIIPYKENISKHTKCSITLKELLTLIENNNA